MAKEVARKGPWSEEEDVQLALFVNMFGDRRWDFIAKVSGLMVGGRQDICLKRTGKSCRLRWVNYLQPGLKRGKITPHEERLILELHSKWGNRWSKIAQKLPGRTDNEIKNYWRTQMRKKAQEGKRAKSPSSSPTSSISSISISPRVKVPPASESVECGSYDTGGVGLAATPGDKDIGLEGEESDKVNSMDDIWKEFEFSEESGSLTTCHAMASPLWNCCPSDSLWSMDEEESKMLMQPMGDPFNYFFPFHNYYMTG